MRWRRIGRLFGSEGQYPWMASYAAMPFAERIEGDLYRVYFTSRDDRNRSHVGWIEIDMTRPDRTLRLSEAPLLGPGMLGRFDHAGATLSWVVTDAGKRYAYYVGWSLPQDVPYHPAIGLVVGDAGRSSPWVALPGPVVERNPADPLFCTAPCVLVEEGRWQMWYVSGLSWLREDGRMIPTYRTHRATSENGVDWRCDGQVALDPQGDEFGFSRPSVLRESDAYLMWYSVRSRSCPYRLGFAQSRDGLAWTRDDGNAGLELSVDGWDSEMIAYPHVFKHGTDLYMLYNGNGYGKSGLGLAVRC
jgi:hypothetical protein